LSPFISLLINKSLTAGCFPAAFKEASVRPLLKKVGLDAIDQKNFRPVSDLPFLSKLLERIVQARLQAFLESNRLMPKTQSAYRKYHSTETAVTRVYNDLLLAADRGQVSALCLLDLTAAFDTVDHELLLLRLERQFGLRGTALMWFRSYLSGRTYRVVYAGSTSSVVYIVCPVPQGSVLGPVLFVLYVADLADIINRHGVTLHSFADDTQLYLHCCREDVTTAATRLKECIVDVCRWMSADRLRLNAGRTGLLWTGSGSTQRVSALWSWSICAAGRRCCPGLRPCAVAWSDCLGWSGPRPPCVRRRFGVFLLAAAASAGSPVARRRVGSHAGSRLCCVLGRLLRSAVNRSARVCCRWVAAGHGRCGPGCGRRGGGVRPRLES